MPKVKVHQEWDWVEVKDFSLFHQVWSSTELRNIQAPYQWSRWLTLWYQGFEGRGTATDRG